jgi:hypothetical protein
MIGKAMTEGIAMVDKTHQLNQHAMIQSSPSDGLEMDGKRSRVTYEHSNSHDILAFHKHSDQIVAF